MSSGRRREPAGCLAAAGWLVATAAGLVLGAWLVGTAVGDRFAWSQPLAWIPTPVALVAAGLGLLAAARPAARPGRRRSRLLRWGVLLVALATLLGLVELRWDAPPPGPGDPAEVLRLAHWNAFTTGIRLDPGGARFLVDLEADVLVIGSAVAAGRDETIRAWLGSDGHLIVRSPFAIASRVPVLEARVLIRRDELAVVRLDLDAVPSLGRPVVVHLVDLPSAPGLGRMSLAREVRAILDGLAGDHGEPAPDRVVGDFNLTRDSAALEVLLPDLEHAYEQAGRGWDATFPRRWPLWHIDHALVGPAVRAVRYEVRVPPVSRHRAQVVEVGASEDGPGHRSRYPADR